MLQFKKIQSLPETLKTGAIERAVEQFVNESNRLNTPSNKEGFFNQLVSTIASILIFKNASHHFFWLAELDNGEVGAFAITHISKDVDNNLCYWGLDAWVDPSLRHTGKAKEWFNLMREDAKKLMCKHFLVISTRNNAAYKRFLGRNWHDYATILKEDL